MFKLLALVAAFATSTYAHGVISDPPRRLPGSTFLANCGQGVYNNVYYDQFGNQQGEEQNIDSGYIAALCPLYLCKGLQFADNTANVQSFPANTVLPITIDIEAPHTGVANVSVVEYATNTVIAGPFISFSPAYSTSGYPANQTSFSVTIPDLDGQCGTAGDCVLQWWWNAASIDQTYMSCVDFTQ